VGVRCETKDRERFGMLTCVTVDKAQHCGGDVDGKDIVAGGI
jgi:hypothetical protein